MILLTKDFADTVAALDRIVPTRTSDPLHSQILITLGAEQMSLRAALPEIDLELRLPVACETQKSILVPAHLLAGVVRSLPGEEVEIAIDAPGALSIESGSFATKLTAVAASEFPPSPDDSPNAWELAASELARSMAQVRYAAANEDYRGAFRGVELGQSQDSFWAVATDSLRLALYQTRAISESSFKILIPANSADELVKIIREETGNLRISINPGGILVEFSRGRVWLALLEGELPDWRAVIPARFVAESRVSADALRETLRRMIILAKPDTHPVDLVFEADQIVVSVEGGYGYAREQLAAQTQGELPLAVSFNARFLEDALKPLKGEALLRLSGRASPAVVTTEQKEGYLAVVMPLRI